MLEAVSSTTTPHTVEINSDLSAICGVLHKIARKHTPNTALSDLYKLKQITKLLQNPYIPITVTEPPPSGRPDHDSTLFKHSIEYRLLRARYSAALSTIADLGARIVRKHKDEFHAGIYVGLRRAAEKAIMFLEDLDNSSLADEDNIKPDNTGGKRNNHNDFVR